jgi:hypothetical protein
MNIKIYYVLHVSFSIFNSHFSTLMLHAWIFLTIAIEKWLVDYLIVICCFNIILNIILWLNNYFYIFFYFLIKNKFFFKRSDFPIRLGRIRPILPISDSDFTKVDLWCGVQSKDTLVWARSTGLIPAYALYPCQWVLGPKINFNKKTLIKIKTHTMLEIIVTFEKRVFRTSI